MKYHPKQILIPLLAALLLTLVNCKKEEPVNQATLSTLSVTNITSSTAQSGGNITSDGGGDITSRGVVWGITASPTVEQSNGLTMDGSGPGLFQSNITNLQPNTTYYVRAYATNETGMVYGSEQQFETMEEESDYGDWPTDTETQVVNVTNPTTGKTYMDRNLGASRAATSSTDAEAYGDLYQLGRAADGHQKRTSGTTSTLSSTDTPGHGDFIAIGSHPYDWRSPQNDNLWQGVNGTNNPCPAGYRLPTDAELNAERLSWSSNNAAGAFASPLKLPVAGYRSRSSGSLSQVGYYGRYWSSTVNGIGSHSLHFNSSNANMGSGLRMNGYSVRCLKE
jgi:hypothetical protein